MRLMQEVRPHDRRRRSGNLLAHRGKVRTALLSKRASAFWLSTLLYGAMFSAHFAHVFRFALEQQYAPHFSLILLVSLSLMLGVVYLPNADKYRRLPRRPPKDQKVLYERALMASQRPVHSF
jgi:hypothetical protein